MQYGIHAVNTSILKNRKCATATRSITKYDRQILIRLSMRAGHQIFARVYEYQSLINYGILMMLYFVAQVHRYE